LEEDRSKGGIMGDTSTHKKLFGRGIVIELLKDISSAVSMTKIKTDNKRPDPLPGRQFAL
jgi:hypothetical protein